MKKHFRGFITLSGEEFNKLWEECIFVFDTNVLLDFFRYDQNTTKALFTIMEQIGKQNRLWFPHQIVLEFLFNQKEILDKQNNAYDHVLTHYKNKVIEFENFLREHYSRHVNLKLEPIFKVLQTSIESVTQEIVTQTKIHPDLASILSSTLMLMNDNVGDPYNQDTLNELYKICDIRYSSDIPPGFKDKNDPKKKNGQKYHDGIYYKDLYGDFIFWWQMIEKARTVGKPIILLTEDSKVDWWLKKGGKIISPLPELIQEFYRETNGLDFYMYRTDTFINYANEYFKLNQSPEQIIEITRNVEDVRVQHEMENQIKTTRLRMQLNPNINLLTKEEMTVFEKMLEEAFESENSLIANNLHSRAFEWAKRLVIPREVELLEDELRELTSKVSRYHPGKASEGRIIENIDYQKSSPEQKLYMLKEIHKYLTDTIAFYDGQGY